MRALHRISAPLVFTTIALFAAAFAPAARANEAQPIEECEIVAKVNDQVILAGELMWEVNLQIEQRLATMPPEMRSQVPPAEMEMVKRMLMQQSLMAMLDLKLFYSDFRRKAPKADLAAIHRSMESTFYKNEAPVLMERVGVDDISQLEERLNELGTTLAERKADFFQKMIARSWLQENIDYNKEVTHDDMLAYYAEHQEEYAVPNRARWEELAVHFDRFQTKGDAWRAIATLGNVAHQASVSAGAGPAFTEIAKSSSHGFSAADGGGHDWTTQGALASEAIDRALFELPVGQMSPILESPQGFHIVRVIERQEAGHTPFREVQSDIRTKIRSERFDKVINSKVAKMKESARIWTVFTGDLKRPEVAQAEAPAQR
ncbi:Foldase protein PrsA 2 precursor [Pseudobythopirellula maris]|uniref:Periplasmic chaperone PpiD n=1 Tax=Pseudobythopirellula maris TaxID=2527991 RepID=A0A5C5ZMD3_9BACT|nr:Foldase protein PrsA 2 precursor [Pseudobythopirellula maris]